MLGFLVHAKLYAQLRPSTYLEDEMDLASMLITSIADIVTLVTPLITILLKSRTRP